MRSSRPCLHRPAASLVALVILAGAALVGCAVGSTSAPSVAAPVVSEAWVRLPTGSDQATAAYFTVTNPASTADVLLGVSSQMASACQLHETAMDNSGMTGMHMVDRLEIPAGSMMRLEPGGYHLMMTGVSPLKVGSNVELDLTFQRAGVVKVMAEVRAG